MPFPILNWHQILSGMPSERSFELPPVFLIFGLQTGRGSARLERLVRDQEVGGSNPPAPTL